MNRIKIIVLFLTGAMIIGACNKKSEPIDLFVKFYPRKCNYIWLVGAENEIKTFDIYSLDELKEIPEGQPVRSENFRLLLYTSNIDTVPDGFLKFRPPYWFHQRHEIMHLWDLDESNPALEDQLKRDFESSFGEKKSAKKIEVASSPFRLEYRTTGIDQFEITATKTIFGKEPGISLNDYFEIVELDPTQIISSERKELVFGYLDWDGAMSIDRWLSFKPMAQPTMVLGLNTIPPELPLEIEFKINMTSNNKRMEDISQEVHLIQ